MYNKLNIIIGVCFLAILASCTQSGGNFAGWEYAPDMYYAKGPEAFRMLQKDTGNPYMHMWLPVKNTIARGKLDYFFPYENTVADYERAKIEVICPATIPASLPNIQEGKRLFDINCIVCHGPQGKADGTIVKDGKFPPPPLYQSDVIKKLSDGGKYFSITYGKNNMGAYGPNLSPEERWKVIHYVNYLSHMDDSTAVRLDLKEEGYLDFYKK
jgi:mono/diheme cytochrome c family protein